MLHVIEYRQYAEQCRGMAKAVRNKARRTQLLQLAMQWDAIARNREKLLAADNLAAQRLRPDTDDLPKVRQLGSRS